MVRLIRPGGGECYVDEPRVAEYLAAGCRPADPRKVPVSRMDTGTPKTALRPLRKRKGLEITH